MKTRNESSYGFQREAYPYGRGIDSSCYRKQWTEPPGGFSAAHMETWKEVMVSASARELINLKQTVQKEKKKQQKKEIKRFVYAYMILTCVLGTLDLYIVVHCAAPPRTHPI